VLLAVGTINGLRPQPAFPHPLLGTDQPARLTAAKLGEGHCEQPLAKPLALLGIQANSAREFLDLLQLADRSLIADLAVTQLGGQPMASGSLELSVEGCFRLG